MKAVKSKAQERREIERQVKAYLQEGGQVETVAPGVSGRDIGSYKMPPVTFQTQTGPRSERTPLLDEIKAIEARRRKPAKLTPPRRKEPRKVLITDDFGEPLRWSWRDS